MICSESSISWIYFLQLATHSPLEITPPKWLLFPPLLACIPLFPLLSKIHSRLRFWAVQTCLNYWPSVGNKHVRIISQSSDLWLIHFKPTWCAALQRTLATEVTNSSKTFKDQDLQESPIQYQDSSKAPVYRSSNSQTER